MINNSAPFNLGSKYANSNGLIYDITQPNFAPKKVKSKKIRSLQDPIHGIIVLEDPV